MKFKLSLIVILLISTFLGCRKDSSTNPDDNEIKYETDFFKNIANNNQEYGDFSALDEMCGDDSAEQFNSKIMSLMFGKKDIHSTIEVQKANF